MNSTASGTVIARTRRLDLRPVHPDDAPLIQPLANNWEVAKQTADLPFPYGQIEAHNLIETAERSAAEGKEQVFSIIRRTDDTLIGLIGLIIDVAPVEVGYWLGQSYWGQGYVSEALAAVQDYARETLCVRKLAAVVFDDNLVSIRVLTKRGFRFQETWQEILPSRGGMRCMRRYVWVAE